MIELANADRVLLQTEKEDDFPPPQRSEDSDTDSLGDSSEVLTLQQALHKAESRHDALQEEVATCKTDGESWKAFLPLQGTLEPECSYEIIKSPAVSGAQSYKELQNEEKQINGLKKQ